MLTRNTPPLEQTTLEKEFQFKPLALAIVLATSGLEAGLVQAATFTVSNTADSGVGSLRAAVIAADGAATDDNIVFDAGLTGSTITLTGSELAHTSGNGSLTITGPTTGDASSITINGGGNSRIINSDTSVTLENLTLTGAVSTSSGGAVRGGDSITLTNTVITGNSANGGGGGGGIFSDGIVTLNQSTVSGNSAGSIGGGIYGYNAVTLNQSTVSGNSAGIIGGGIYSYNAITLNQSTVSGNSTTNRGGGIYSYYGSVNIDQSTITANSATRNGGGIYVYDATVTLSNSILSGNSGVNGNIDFNDSLNLNATNSLFGDPAAEIGGTNTANVFTDAPNLGSLQDNGGGNPNPLTSSG